MPTATTRYFLAADRQTQIAADMSDALHKRIWGRMSYGNRPYEGVELVEVSDADAWIEAQMAVRVAKAAEQGRAVSECIAAARRADAARVQKAAA